MDFKNAVMVAVALLLINSASEARAQDQPADKVIGILLTAGDIAHCGTKVYQRRHDATAKLLGKEIADANEKGIPLRILPLGDLAYETGTDAQFECFHHTWGAYRDIMWPVPGNHEYQKNNGLPYFRYFAHEPSIVVNGIKKPLVSLNGARTGYYSVNFPNEDGPWRLIALNAYVNVKKGLSGQLTWLKDDLKTAATIPCILAFWHPPIFSSGRHGHGYREDPNAELTIEKRMQPAYRALYEQGASVILNGHDHNFEQFGRQDADGQPVTHGVRSFVVGTGGSLLTNRTHTGKPLLYAKSAKNSERYWQDSYSILKMELLKDSYRWSFMPIKGSSSIPLDPVSDKCNDRPNP